MTTTEIFLTQVNSAIPSTLNMLVIVFDDNEVPVELRAAYTESPLPDSVLDRLAGAVPHGSRDEAPRVVRLRRKRRCRRPVGLAAIIRPHAPLLPQPQPPPPPANPVQIPHPTLDQMFTGIHRVLENAQNSNGAPLCIGTETIDVLDSDEEENILLLSEKPTVCIYLSV